MSEDEKQDLTGIAAEIAPEEPKAEASTSTAAAQKSFTVADVFGGDDSDSDLSSDEDEKKPGWYPCLMNPRDRMPRAESMGFDQSRSNRLGNGP